MKLKPGKALFQTLLFILAVFLLSSLSLVLGYILKQAYPAEYGLTQGGRQDLEVTYKEILFFISIILALFLVSLSLLYVKRKGLKIFLVSLALVYMVAACLMVLVDVIYYLIFACRINFSAIQTALNTDPEEARGFIRLYCKPGVITALLAFVAAVALVIFNRNRLVALFLTPSFFTVTLCICVLGIIDFGQLAHSKGNGVHNVRYWDIVVGEYNEYKAFNRKLEAEKNNHNFSPEYDGFYKQDTLTKTLVLVISESLSKRHMSLYGYPRNTTPHLDTNRSIIKFNDCVTQAALTIEAVPALFFNGYLSQRINLIALLNKMNYETSWISNQSGWGKRDHSIVLLSQLSKKTIFLDSLADDDKSNTSLHYDEAVLDQFDKVLGAPSRSSKFVVLHLMGCHFDYERRYPAGRSFFTQAPPAKVAVNTPQTQKVINSYDNAVLYHDSIINEVLKIFSQRSVNKNSVLVFLSDHGEELYENRDHAGHGYPPSRVTSEIPYFTVLSSGFKKNYPAVEEVMKKRCNTPYSTANNFYTLVHLLNISSGVEKQKSKILKKALFSSEYDSTCPRLVMGSDYSQMNP